jgi:hypothetical protein
MGLEPTALCLGNIPSSTLWRKYPWAERKAFSYGAFVIGYGREMPAPDQPTANTSAG